MAPEQSNTPNRAIFQRVPLRAGTQDTRLRAGVESRLVLPRPRSPDPAPSQQDSPISALL